MNRFPKYSTEKELEEISKRYFMNCLPTKWICDEPKTDVGIDFRIEITNKNGGVEGPELLVQLKSTSRENITKGCNFIKISNFKVSTYNYLSDKLQVVIVVKYIQNLKKAFWILLRDIPEPCKSRKTFTIKIPVQNVLNNDSWKLIEEHVQYVHFKKRKANKS